MKTTPTRTIVAGAFIALATLPLIAVPTADHTAGIYIIMLATSKAIAFALIYGAIRIYKPNKHRRPTK